MSSDSYFVIRCSEDGDVSLELLRKEELNKRLNSDYWGATNEQDDLARELKFGDYFDLTERAGMIIIKGRAVQPIARQRVTDWDVE